MLSSLDLSEGQNSVSISLYCISEDRSSLCLSLGHHDLDFGILLIYCDDMLLSQSPLVLNLFFFDRPCELLSIFQVGDSYIIENDVKLLSSILELWFDFGRYLFSLCNQLRGIILGNSSFHDFIQNGRNDSWIVLHTQIVEDDWKLGLDWSVQNSQCHSSFLQVSGTRLSCNLLWLGSDLKCPDSLDDWNSEVDTFSVDFWENSSGLVENKGSVATINDKAKLVGKESWEGQKRAHTDHSVKNFLHLDCVRVFFNKIIQIYFIISNFI